MYKISLLFSLFIAVFPGLSQAEEVKPAYNFSLTNLAGNTVQLSDYRGQWVVVNYWATWCAPCIKEIPELSELHTERDDITVLGLDYEDIERARLDEFLAKIEVSYPILLLDVYAMPEGMEIPRALPTTYIVNPEGMRVRTFIGPVTRAEVEKAVDTAAGKQ
ncbi:MAG: TlpA family protein disulfide reductase [Xanthomonadales bacterium]|nr:TlpA family protein disulfide reductase [Xanthomonadales bacterium]